MSIGGCLLALGYGRKFSYGSRIAVPLYFPRFFVENVRVGTKNLCDLRIMPKTLSAENLFDAEESLWYNAPILIQWRINGTTLLGWDDEIFHRARSFCLSRNVL